METEVAVNTQGDSSPNTPLFIGAILVVFSEIIAGVYTVLSLFSFVPFDQAILFIWLGLLVLTNLILFYIAHLNRKKIGIRLKIFFVLWPCIVLWCWVFSPLFYVISTNFTQTQLKVAAFAYFWEIPLIGGAYIIFCLLYFRPMYRYLIGEKSNIKDPQQAYDFLHSFPYKVGIVLVIFIVLGFVIGTFQQIYFAQMSLFEQVKLIIHGVVTSFLSGLCVALILDTVFNDFRRKIKIQNPAHSLSRAGFTQKIVITTFVVVAASFGFISVVGSKISQDIIKNVVVYNTVANFEDISNFLNQNNMSGKEAVVDNLSVHLGSRVEAFIFENDSLGSSLIAPETIAYIKAHPSGDIEDNRAEIKEIVFRIDPITFKKEVAIVYLADYYSYFLESINFVVFASVLVIIFVSLIMILFTRTVRDVLGRIRKAIKSGEGDVLNLKLSTGDEFEEFADSLGSYANQAKELRDGLEDKIKEKTASLAEKLEELQESSNSLENMDKAMINILEDARELEEGLKKEKEGVEKKVAERTLQLSEEKSKLQASINSLGVGFIMTDKNNNLLIMNDTASRALCLNGEDFNPGLMIHPISRKCDINEIQSNLQSALDLKVSVGECITKQKPLDFPSISHNGRFLHFVLTPIVTLDANLEVIGCVIWFEDITEAKIVERSKDEFFSIASHELRTPLTSIRGNTSMIQDYYADSLKDPQLKEMIDDIHESSVRLIEIVNDFLDMGRLEQGKMVFKKEEFDLLKVIEGVIYEVAPTLKEKGVFLKLEPPTLGSVPHVFADSDRTKQVVYNLIGNATKFTQKGGVTLKVISEKGFLKVMVTDTGRGISPENQSLLFHKFQQANTSLLTRDTTRGTGLGLYISKIMVESMGGQIALENSEEGKGSVFSFTLPLSNGKEVTDTK